MDCKGLREINILAANVGFIWVLFGRVATALISIASLHIMTTLLEPKSFGLYSLLIAFQGFAGLILISPVGLHINRNMHAWWDDHTLINRLRLFNKYLSFVAVSIAGVVVAWWLLYQATDQSINGAILASMSVGLIIFFGTWCTLFAHVLNMLGFRRASVGWMLASSIIGLIISSALAFEYRSAASWMLGQAIGMAVGTIGAGLMLRRYQAARESSGLSLSKNAPVLLDRLTIITYCLPLVAATSLMWLQNTGYRFWVGGTWGTAELGLLAVGLSISTQIWAIIETLATQFLNPYFFRHIAEAKSEAQKSAVLSDMVNVMWPIYAVLAGFNLVVASSLLTVLTDDRYHNATMFVMLGVFIEFARCTANLWSYAAQIERRTTEYIVPYGLGALIVWLGAIGLTYVHGDVVLMAGVLVFSGSVMCAAMILIMQRMVSVQLDIGRWLVGGAMLLICLSSVIIMPIETEGFIANVGITITGMLFAGSVMLALLWRNQALRRLLAVSLRSEMA